MLHFLKSLLLFVFICFSAFLIGCGGTFIGFISDGIWFAISAPVVCYLVYQQLNRHLWKHTKLFSIKLVVLWAIAGAFILLLDNTSFPWHYRDAIEMLYYAIIIWATLLTFYFFYQAYSLAKKDESEPTWKLIDEHVKTGTKMKVGKK